MSKKIYVVDVDGTICKAPPSRNYSKCEPIPEVILKVNKLYEEGNTIILHTARGQLSTKGNKFKIETDVREILVDWLDSYGVKYHELVMCKPYGDHYIDDKAMSIEGFLNE